MSLPVSIFNRDILPRPEGLEKRDYGRELVPCRLLGLADQGVSLRLRYVSSASAAGLLLYEFRC